MNLLPPVTIVVLNWNGRHLLQSCLPALLALDYPQYALLLVDNASTDDSIAYVRSHFPQVQLLQNDRNLGYAAGNNHALRAADTPFVALVNPDIVVAATWLRELMVPFTDPRVGIVGSRLYYPGGTQLQHAGGAVHLPRALPEHFGNGAPGAGPFGEQRDVPYVIGAATALRCSMLDEIGLFDEGFFLYYEDADICTRARRAGYRIVYRPQATAIHDESALTQKGSKPYLIHFHSSRWRYLLKHAPPQVILDETLPLEKQWATGAGPIAAHVCRHLLAHFHEILGARVRDGASPVPAAAATELVDALRALRAAAWSSPSWETLRAAAQLQEQPFRSSLPLVGRLIAAVRAAWNRVATRAYVRPLVKQQAAFNEALLHQLEAQQPALAQHEARGDESALALSQTRADLLALITALATIDARLARLEQTAHSDEEE
jgi:GT2 family glycosyltransferase